MAENKLTPIIYYWKGSPWASKITSYLDLRHIPYVSCIQPLTMPRPDLADLGVAYRRIPVVSIGKDVYCDTLLILSKLETLYPATATSPTLSPETGEQKAIELLLEKWTDLAVFPQAADCIPLDHPLVQDPKFIEDRTQLWGESWSRETREPKRAPALAAMRSLFSLLEHTILADSRDWILKTPHPTLADIHTAWIFSWMYKMDGAFPENIISEHHFPKTWAWCNRYTDAVEKATKENGFTDEITGAEALKRMGSAQFAEKGIGIDEHDPLKLKSKQQVKVSPIDTGFTAIQTGELVGISESEIVIGSKTKDGVDIRVHNPRLNYKVA